MKRPVVDAREVCFQMLTAVLEEKAYSNLVLQQSLRNIQLSQQDKNFAAAMFYGTITRLYSLDFYLQKYLSKDISKLDPSVRTILRMGAWQIIFSHSVPSFAAVDQMVQLAKKHTHQGGVSVINAVLRNLSQEDEAGKICLEQERFDVKYSLSKELSGCFIKWYGRSRAESIAQALLGEPTVTARVNLLRTTKEDLKEQLALEGVTTEDGIFMKEALGLKLGGMPVYELPSFKAGLFMIQDEAAMLAAYILAPKMGQNILDVCGAPGGKSCHLAEIIQDNGHILSLDVNESRLKMIVQNQDRLDLKSISAKVADATRLEEDFPELVGTFNAVLVDVPCSGLGLLLKKPDIRLNMTYNKIQELIPIQAAILRQAAACTAPGGTLLYSTCTINPQENQDQVQRFLAENSNFETYPFEDILPEALQSEDHCQTGALGYIGLLPDQDHCDGFFVARLRRKI